MTLEDTTCRIAIRVVRGVGSEGRNAALEATRSVLTLAPSLQPDMEEINWSWQRYIPRPKEDGSGIDQLLLKSSQRVRPAGWLSDAYLRNLGVAFRTAGLRDLERICVNPWIRGPWLAVSLFLLSCSLSTLAFSLAAGAIWGFQFFVRSWLALLSAATIAGIFASLRAPHFFAGVRGIGLLLAWPVVWVLLLPFSSGMWYVVFAVGALLGASVLDHIGLPQSWLLTEISPGSFVYSSSNREFAMLFVNTIVVLSGLIVYRLIYVACRVQVEPLLKIVADVVLYLGDPRYRRAIIADTQRSIVEASNRGATDLVLLGHSLGSVICVDAMRTIAPLPFQRIVLVTAGSPLHRLFYRLFPRSYPSPADLLRQLQSVHTNFDWVNVYRLKDPIGGSLLLPDKRDLKTPQNDIGWLQAHLNYWSDPVVHQTVKGYLEGAAKGPICINRTLSSAPSPLDGVQRPAPFWFCSFYFVCAAISISICSQWFSSPVREINEVRRAMAAVALLTHVPGRVFWYGEEERVGERGMAPIRSHRLLVAFKTREGEIRKDFVTEIRCDRRQIFRAILESPSQTATVPGDGRLARVIDVDVGYIPDRPSAYLIGDCRRTAIATPVVIASWLFVVSSWLGTSLIVTYTAANSFSPFIAGAVGLRDIEWIRIRERFGRMLNSVPHLREAILAAWTIIALLFLVIVAP